LSAWQPEDGDFGFDLFELGVAGDDAAAAGLGEGCGETSA